MVLNMCSIAGFIDFARQIKYDAITKMNDALAHRGPDQNGIAQGDCFCFGHNRLSVVDVENGRQPMTRHERGYEFTIVYNGELYNTQELQSELLNKGYKFNTHCDTEVLLVSYIEWGVDCLKRLNGIFAFAIYDGEKRSVFLARDRMGVKPLFFTIKGTTTIFASEIKALLNYPGIEPRISREGIWQIIFLSPTRIPTSGVFKGIYELESASYMYISENGIKRGKYWKLEANEHKDDYNTTVEKTRELLKDTIRRQLVSDVPLCTFLSGGMDSSVITCEAQNAYAENGTKLSTYSFDFQGNDIFFKPTSFQPNSDNDYAIWLSEHIGTNHARLLAKSEDLINHLNDAVRFRDLPGMADIDSSLLYFCRKVKENHTVAISGECADEIFGGYPWFYVPEMANKNSFPWIHSLEGRANLFQADFANTESGLEFVQQHYSDSIAQCPKFDGDNEENAQKRKITWLNINWFMYSLLERKDRMSMASGLEVRVPFADHRLMQYVFNVPWEYKFKDNVEKSLLRAAADFVPERILNRKKSPYPKTHNPAYEQLISDILEQRISSKNSRLSEIINRDALIELKGKENATWFGQLMSKPQLLAFILQLDFWFEHYKVSII